MGRELLPTLSSLYVAPKMVVHRGSDRTSQAALVLPKRDWNSPERTIGGSALGFQVPTSLCQQVERIVPIEGGGISWAAQVTPAATPHPLPCHNFHAVSRVSSTVSPSS